MRADNTTLAQALSNETLHLILYSTEACNFRCTYCYESFAQGRMKPEVVRGVNNLLRERASELEHLELSWFGGEPLLALDVVEGVMQHALDLRASNPRLHVQGDMTTNAWMLTRPVFERLLELCVTTYQITFDGPKLHHDKKRLRADGAGTFDRVWRNVAAMRDVAGEFHVLLRVHADQDNLADLPGFVDDLRATFGADPRFEIFVRPLSRYGGPNDASLHTLSDESALAELRQRADPGRPVGTPRPDQHGTCYASRANSFAIRADGRINKCTIALEHPLNQVGRIREDGTLEISNAKIAGWLRGLHSGKTMELFCPMIGYAEPQTSQRAAS